MGYYTYSSINFKLCVFMCMYMCMMVCGWYFGLCVYGGGCHGHVHTKIREGQPVSFFIILQTSPLRKDPLLNLAHGWWSVSPSESPIWAFYYTGITVICWHIFYISTGVQFRSSYLHSRNSYPLRYFLIHLRYHFWIIFLNYSFWHQVKICRKQKKDPAK